MNASKPPPHFDQFVLNLTSGGNFLKTLSYINSFNPINYLRSTQRWVSEFRLALQQVLFILKAKKFSISFE